MYILQNFVWQQINMNKKLEYYNKKSMYNA